MLVRGRRGGCGGRGRLDVIHKSHGEKETKYIHRYPVVYWYEIGREG